MSETEQRLATKTKTVLLWVATAVGALGMLAAGVTKFTSAEMWNQMFTDWGYSIGFKSLIGALEIGGALLVVAPRFATYAATLLVVIMIGAVYTVVVSRSDLGVAAPLGNLVLFAIIALARRKDAWKPGG